MRRIIVGFLAALVAVGATVVAAQTQSTPVAEVNGAVITDDEVTRVIGMQLARLENQIHQFKLQRIEGSSPINSWRLKRASEA